MSIDDRLKKLEREAVARRAADDPRVRLQIVCEAARMESSVPAPAGTKERRNQIANLAAIEKAREAGDTSILGKIPSANSFGFTCQPWNL